jgi:transcriptional regulator with PAS, ATPase and Fis domain
MRFKAKDLVRILSAVDGDTDVVFHIEEDDNNRYIADSVTIKEGQTYDDDFDETEITLHISITPSGTYNYKMEEYKAVLCTSPDQVRNEIEAALRKHNGDRKAAAKELKISDRTLYRKLKQYGLDK